MNSIDEWSNLLTDFGTVSSHSDRSPLTAATLTDTIGQKLSDSSHSNSSHFLR